MDVATPRAFTIHIFTACGAALAFLALILATGGHWAAMFLCLGLALIVDAVDDEREAEAEKHRLPMTASREHHGHQRERCPARGQHVDAVSAESRKRHF